MKITAVTPLTSLGQRLIRQQWIKKAFLVIIFGWAAWALGNKAVAAPSSFFYQILNGVQLGFVYALIALGYTMVYGIVKLINFAHGDVFMVGAFTSFFSISFFKLHTWPATVFPGINNNLSILIGTITVVLISMITCVILAVTIERVAYKPLRDAPRISALITAIGVSFFLEYFGALPYAYNSNYTQYQRPFELVRWYIKGGVHRLPLGDAAPEGSIVFSSILVIIVIVTLLLLGTLQFIVRRTKTGKAMRAVSYDKGTARLMGIGVDGIISVTFAIGAALAGAGGVLYAIAFPQLTSFVGILPGLKAFVAAVLGGIGSIPGAMVGSLIIGQAETLSAAYISSPMRDAIVFTILILVLLIRPTGIFGEPEREKA